MFKKGQSGNPGGLTKEQRKARDELRDALAGDAPQVHGALMSLVKKRNPQAVIYAHQLIHGKEADRVDVKHSGGVARVPTEAELRSAELIATAWLATKRDDDDDGEDDS